MKHERAFEIARLASEPSSHRDGLPLRASTVTNDGYGLAIFDYFDRPGYISLQQRFFRAGGRAVTFRIDCEDGKQKSLCIYFLERNHE